MEQPSVIHADLDAFFASVEQKLNPQLRGKPIIVTNTDPQGRNCFKGIVSTCSYEARKFGVHSGMSVWQARKLCPKGFYVKGNYDQYQKHSQIFFSVLKHFSPYVEPISIDEGFVSLKGAELLYSDFTQTAHLIKKTVNKESGLTCSLGLAKSRVVAKVASDFNKPDGLTVVPLGQEKCFLAPLPIRKLPGVGKQIEIWLKEALEKDELTIGDLANQSLLWIEKNLGQAGLNLWQAANGIDSVWFSPRNQPQKSISRSLTFPQDNHNPAYLLAQTRLLAEQIAAELFKNHQTTSCISLQLRTQEFKNSSKQQTCQSVWQGQEIFSLAKKLFYQIWQPNTSLRLVGLNATHLKAQNLNLFAQFDEEKEKLAEGIEKARNKYGFESILPASTLFLAKK